MWWVDLTDAEIATARDLGALVAIPLGAIEQHGPHLPVDTDVRSVTAITLMAAARTSQVKILVGPALPLGLSPHHKSFPGTISLRLSTLVALLRDAAMCLFDSGFKRVAIVNGHGGNSAVLRAIAMEMVAEGLPLSLSTIGSRARRFGRSCFVVA